VHSEGNIGRYIIGLFERAGIVSGQSMKVCVLILLNCLNLLIDGPTVILHHSRQCQQK
jgi:hypothetical protein